jgi:glucosamine-6-phosphate deaminase
LTLGAHFYTFRRQGEKHLGTSDQTEEIFVSSEFRFEPSQWVPFRDKEVCDRVRRIRRADLDKHPNPDFQIRIVPDARIAWFSLFDRFRRIQEAAQAGRSIVFILGNPNPGYRQLAWSLNAAKVDCHRLHVFIMDEWADQDGNIAPESYPQGFMRAFKKYFYSELDPVLRPPESQIVGPTNANIGDYQKMIDDAGGCDVCYSGPGWTGHIAFIEPDAPEFEARDLEEWKGMGARVCTLSPFTIAQNSLHACFGYSGDMANVPPKAATIGPLEVLAAKHRVEVHALLTQGTRVSWQRFISRLILHGPVTPRVPASILQTVRTDVYVSESMARDIEPVWYEGY